ncbi:hypothetical protein PW5551_03355 [Petrotoga sp. 9PW.55.5.1]|uniref:DUF4912 domain-containing protein n=1 Tax=Petrotoga sp. 9PW.55.5.1 TaxID=1308979 RepID=UPI000DC37BAA|nr:DUF4912 domain-containing protein [Petrotoga sp. 9PW.55.5.1]RAO99533.1 hypothetical protein PW5551_03355 [Petrotoga sp. 9PW.55.5.1]
MKVKKLEKELLDSYKTEEPTIQELRSIAKSLGIKLKRTLKKKEILKLVQIEIQKLLDDSIKTKENEKEKSPKKVKIESKIKTSLKSNEAKEVPKNYNKDRIKMIPVNPNWVYVYWDFSKKTKMKLNELSKKNKLSLRMVQILEKEDNERTFEKNLSQKELVNNYFFNVPQELSKYKAYLGIKDEKCGFHPIIESNKVITPSSSLKKADKEEWLILKENKILKNKSKGSKIKVIERLLGSSEKSFVSEDKLETIISGKGLIL